MKKLIISSYALLMLIGLNTFAWAAGEHYIAVASDRHSTTTAISDAMGGMPSGVEYVCLNGDMVDGTGSYNSSTILNEVKAVFGELDNSTVSIIKGYQHDNGCTDDAQILKSTSGLIYTAMEGEMAVCYIYGISYQDMYSKSEQATCDAVTAFKQWVDGLSDNAPIIVCCHIPLHYQRGDNGYAPLWSKALNYAATGQETTAAGAELKRNVVFLHAHNHTTESNYEYYIPQGSTMQVFNSSNSHYTYYTYTTCGYLRDNKAATLIAVTSNGEVTLTKYANQVVANIYKSTGAKTDFSNNYDASSATHTLAAITTVPVGPVISVSPSSTAFEGYVGETYTKEFSVTGTNLAGAISASISGTGFSIDTESIVPTDGSASGTVIVTWAPTEAGTATGTLTLSSVDADDVTATITATAIIPVPVISTSVTSLSFSAFKNNSASQTFTVSGEYMAEDIAIALADENGVFSVDKTSVSSTDGTTEETEVTVTFLAQQTGEYTGTITLSSANATPVTISLTATAEANVSTVYKLVDAISAGKNYLIVNTNSETAEAYVLSHNDDTVGKTQIAITTDSEGDYVINSVDDANAIWTAQANSSGFTLSNTAGETTYYLEAYGSTSALHVNSPQEYSARYWTYSDYQLGFVGGNSNHYINYNDGFTSAKASSSTTYLVYLFEETTIEAAPTLSVDPTSATLEGYVGETYTKAFAVTGTNLAGAISASISGTGFSIDTESIVPTDGSASGTVTVTWAPTGAGTATGTLTLSSVDADDVTATITATASVPVPVISTSVTSLSFSAFKNNSASKTFTVSGEYMAEDITIALADENGVFSVDKTSVSSTDGTAEETEVTVTFLARQTGEYTGTVTLSSANASPVTISLTGTAEANVITVYKLVNTLTTGKNYLIANGNSGTVTILGQSGGSQSNSSAVVTSGTTYIESEVNASCIWTATESNNTSAEGPRLINNGYAVYPSSSSLGFSNSLTSTSGAVYTRYWSFSDGALAGISTNSSSTKYYMTYSSSSFTTSTSASENTIYLFEETTIEIAPTLSVDPTSATLEGYVGETYTKVFSVTGTNLAGNISASISGTGFSIDTESIVPTDGSASGTITVTWAPAEAGTATGTLTLSSVDADDVTATITATASVPVPVISTSVTSLSFSAFKNNSASQTFTVSGEYMAEDIAIALADENGVFSVDKTSVSSTDGTAEETEVTVTFKARQTGEYSGTITLSSANATPVTISLTGTAEANVITVYKLVNTLTTGKNYLIANGNSGTVTILGQSDGSQSNSSAVVTSGTTYIESEVNASCIWTATESNNTSAEGPRLINNGYAVYPSSSSLGFSSSLTSTSGAVYTRYWSFSDGALAGISTNSSTTYYMTYSSNSFSLSTSASENTIYLFEETTIEVAPTLSVDPTSVGDFTYFYDRGPSENQSFKVTVSDYDSETITASVGDDNNFEISSDGTTYGSSVTLTNGDTFYARLKADLIAGSYTGTITISNEGADDVTLNLTGTVTITGDINGDGKLTTLDATLIRQHIVKLINLGELSITIGE